MVTSTTYCPDCGRRTGNLGSHRGSMGCRADAAQRDAEARGLVQCSGNAGGLLDDAGVANESLHTSFAPGSIGKRGVLSSRLWTTRTAAMVLEATHGMSRKRRVAALRLAHQTSMLALALTYAAATGDATAITTLLTANGV